MSFENKHGLKKTQNVKIPYPRNFYLNNSFMLDLMEFVESKKLLYFLRSGKFPFQILPFHPRRPFLEATPPTDLHEAGARGCALPHRHSMYGQGSRLLEEAGQAGPWSQGIDFHGASLSHVW